MAYIETLAPRDWGFCTLFGYPYVEGVRNISLTFPCCSQTADPPPSLCQRVKHLVIGILLLIPLVNTVIFIAIRFFFQNTVIQDEIEPINSPLTPRRLEKITTINDQRQENVIKLSNTYPENDRTQLLQQIQTLEKEASGVMTHEDAPLVTEHNRMSLNKEREMTIWDGVITYTIDDNSSFRVEGNAMPSATFTQVGGLTQLKPRNYLCGYYALFFLLNAVTGKENDHTNRDKFNDCFSEWHNLIIRKRVSVWLATHRNIPIPKGLVLPGHGLSWGDMHYLIQNSKALAPLQETTGCFMIEMDVYDDNVKGEETVLFFGKSKMEFDSFNRCPTSHPLFIILKGKDLHYYLFYSRTPGEFTVVHSLNHSISNPEYFDPITFTKIIKALTGSKTPLRLEW